MDLLKPAQIVAAPPRDEEDDFEPPTLRDRGELLFDALQIGPDEFEIEVLGCTGSAFWLDEGGFADHWVEDNVRIPRSGRFLLTGITGWASHDGFTGESDVDFEWQHMQAADDMEAL